MKRALAILPPKPIKMFEPRAVQLLCADAAPSGFRPLTSLLKALYPQSPEGNRPRNPSFLQQLLGELCAFVGPFEHILGRIRDELVRRMLLLLETECSEPSATRLTSFCFVCSPQALSIYSEYYSSQGGDLAFDQIPWFVVVEKLENEKRVLLADREKFTAALLEHQEAMTRVEAQVTMLQKKVQDAEAAAKAASQKLELISEKEKKAVMEAGGAKEELKRTRKELMKIKDELRKRTEEAAAARAEAEETESALRLRMEHLKREAADARAEAERAEHLRNELVPKSLVEAAEDTVKELRLEIKKYEERADEARLDRIREIMTPRVNWKALDPFGEGEPAPGTSSKEIIKRMVKRLKKQEEGMPSKKACRSSRTPSLGSCPAPCMIDACIIAHHPRSWRSSRRRLRSLMTPRRWRRPRAPCWHQSPP